MSPETAGAMMPQRGVVVLLSLLFALPLAASEGSYRRESSFQPTHPAFFPADEFFLLVPAGHDLHVTLALEDADALAYVNVIPPSLQCANLGCLAGGGAFLDCSRYASELGAGRVAVWQHGAEGGWWKLTIAAALAEPAAYALDVNLPEASVRYVRPNGILPGLNAACLVADTLT
jgi:hypothetical protein